MVAIHKENRQMKKLMTLMIGAALAFGAVSVYAQEKGETKSTTITKSTKITKTKGTKAPKKVADKK
jgi:hypothetical protein